MAQEVFLYQKPVIDTDDKVCSVNVGAAATGTPLAFSDGQTSFRTRVGKRARLASVANSVDPGAENLITFHILVNGAYALPPYDTFTQSMGETYRGDSRIAVPVELPQGALIQIVADNADAATAWNAYARIRVEYEDL